MPSPIISNAFAPGCSSEYPPQIRLTSVMLAIYKFGILYKKRRMDMHSSFFFLFFSSSGGWGKIKRY